MRFRHRDVLMFEARVPGTSVRQAGAHDPANEDPALSLSLSLSLSVSKVTYQGYNREWL